MLLQLGVTVYDVSGVLGASQDHLRNAVAAFTRHPPAHETPMKSMNKRGQTAKITPNAD
jgi:hypothetical protein